MKKLTVLAFLIVLPFFTINSQWTVQNVATSNPFYSVVFKNPTTGWIAGNNAAVYKTINGGLNWTLQPTGLASGQFNSLSFPNVSTGWAIGAYQTTGMTGYIYRTTNGGNNWVQQMAAADHIFYASFAYDTATCWVAGTFQGTTAAIIKTVNGGNNWTTQVYGTYTPIRSIFFINPQTGWAAGSNTMLKTTNSGLNWSPNTFSGNVRSLYFLDLMNGWAGTADGQLLKTTNGGISWSSNCTGVNYASVSSIQFLNPSMGFFANGTMVFKTTNGGNSWTPMETGAVFYILGMNCLSINNIYAVNMNGDFVYTNNGGGTYATNTVTYYRNNLNKPITMNNTTYDTINISINAPKNLILDVNAMIDTVINGVDSGLVFILSHQGTHDTLIYRVGGSGNNFIKTVLNDSAAISINNGTPPFTGTFRPTRPLSQFNFLSVNGLWVLRIKETSTGTRLTGVIKSWGITVNYNLPISVKKISELVPANFELSQNYPNPFNPTTTIKFKLKDSKYTTLIIYDLLGREIATLIKENLKAGEYETDFDGTFLSSGIYFYRFNSGDFSETKKMVLIK